MLHTCVVGLNYNFNLENLELKKFDVDGITFYDKEANLNIAIDQENLNGLVEILIKLFPTHLEKEDSEFEYSMKLNDCRTLMINSLKEQFCLEFEDDILIEELNEIDNLEELFTKYGEICRRLLFDEMKEEFHFTHF